MRTKTGVVVSTKMAKTVVVRVDEYKNHPKYDKRYRVSKKFYAHTEDQTRFEEGQKVEIEETRPTSKTKRWKIVGENEQATTK